MTCAQRPERLYHLCHPWSAEVVKWLSEEILGINRHRPGLQPIRFSRTWPDPDLCERTDNDPIGGYPCEFQMTPTAYVMCPRRRGQLEQSAYPRLKRTSTVSPSMVRLPGRYFSSV